jgi:hypothetical protein
MGSAGQLEYNIQAWQLAIDQLRRLIMGTDNSRFANACRVFEVKAASATGAG